MIIEGLYDATYYVENNKPIILLFTRQNNEKKIISVDNFLPTIYVDKKDYLENQNTEIIKYNTRITLKNLIVKLENISQKFVKDKNVEVIKLTLNNPFDVYNIKNVIKTFESDILFPDKYVIDKVEELKPTNYRFNFFDIETTSELGFPNYLEPKEKIISVASYDNYDDSYITWIWHEKYKKEIINEVYNNIPVKINRFNKEEDMLNSYLDYIQSKQPDYLIAWNVAFDIKYLIKRCEYLNLPTNKLSPLYNDTRSKYVNKNSLVKWRTGPSIYAKRGANVDIEQTPIIYGLKYFDLLLAFKHINAKEYQIWNLDYIAEKELGISKLRTHFDIGKTWKTSPEFIEQYNYIDVYLIKKINEKLDIFNRFEAIKNTAFLIDMNDAFASGKILDNYVLKKFKDKYIFPNKIYNPNIIKILAGGFVRQPIAGVYDNVAVLDFSGFYPNIMKTFNISGDVLIKENIIFLDNTIDEIQDVSEFKDFIPDYNEEKNQITYKIRTQKFKADLTYDLNRRGVMSESVNDLIILRNQAKKEMKKFNYGTIEYDQKYKKQFSYKFIINAAYGTAGYPGFRLYSNSTANAITGFARMLSKWVSYKLDKKGWKTLGGDTDSLFIQLSTITLEENLTELKQVNTIIKEIINEFVSKFLPKELCTHSLEMEIGQIYSSMLLLDVTKRYAGLLKYYDGKEVDNKLHYMGLDAKKSNITELSKEAQLELVTNILQKKDLKLIFSKYYQQIMYSNDVNLFKLSSKLEKHQNEYKIQNIPNVRSTLWSNKHLGTKFRGGTKFYILYVIKTKEIDTDVIAFDDVEQIKHLNIKINKEKYIDDLYNKFDNMIRGIPELKNMNEIIYKQITSKNNSLDKWISH